MHFGFKFIAYIWKRIISWLTSKRLYFLEKLTDRRSWKKVTCKQLRDCVCFHKITPPPVSAAVASYKYRAAPLGATSTLCRLSAVYILCERYHPSTLSLEHLRYIEGLLRDGELVKTRQKIVVFKSKLP